MSKFRPANPFYIANQTAYGYNITYGSSDSEEYRDMYGDPLPEKHPKLLDTQYRYFRVFIREDLREQYGQELPVVPLTRNIKSKALLEYANEKYTIKSGELIQYKRFDSRGYPQYIFETEDKLEIVLGPAFINTKFLFPINKG